MMAIAFSVLSVSAQNEEKLVVNAGNTEQISIASDMNVILMPGAETEQLISLDAKAAEKLNVTVSNNSMMISLVRRPSATEKLTVYLYVNKLKKITVEDNSTVTTVGVLQTPKLDVYVEGDAIAHLKTNGDIKAYPLNGGEEIKIKYLSDWLARY